MPANVEFSSLKIEHDSEEASSAFIIVTPHNVILFITWLLSKFVSINSLYSHM